MAGPASLFSAAEAYERFMGRWSSALAPLLVHFAGVRDGDRVLDVGSGTGSLAGAAAVATPTGMVVGIDPSAPYVAYAQTNHGGNPRLSFHVGDAQQMPFPAAAFDRTLSLLVLSFIADPRKAVAEMRRVTRPAGTVAAAVWDYGNGMEMLRLFWDEAIALHPSSEAKDERYMALCRPGELATLWHEVGLVDVIEQALTIETRFSSFDDYWTPFLSKQGPAGAFVASFADEQRDTLRTRLQHRLLGDGPDRPFALHARAWAVRGTVR